LVFILSRFHCIHCIHQILPTVQDGTEAIKGDFRVAADNVGMVMHSSPVEWWESSNCAGMLVEQTPSEKLKTCDMALTNFTFISAVDMLAFANDNVRILGIVCSLKSSFYLFTLVCAFLPSRPCPRFG
jgi:hypothetical protein